MRDYSLIVHSQQTLILPAEMCHNINTLLTVTLLGEPRGPLGQRRPVLQGDPAEDVPWSVGQAGEHPRCGRARF